MQTKKAMSLSPRQSAYLEAYSSPSSESFGNSYQSAVKAGYSVQTARNLTHMQPVWLSENIGHIQKVINPDELMQRLTDVIRNPEEPTIIRLKATELAMKAYSMTASKRAASNATVNVNIDLTA